jgi:hypothetical protein
MQMTTQGPLPDNGTAHARLHNYPVTDAPREVLVLTTMGCCCCRQVSHSEPLIDEPLSIKSIRMAAYNVVKLSPQFKKREQYWNSAVVAVGGHYMDISFYPVYTKAHFKLLFKNAQEVLLKQREPETLFDFLPEDKWPRYQSGGTAEG